MKYNDNGTYKDIYVKAFDTLPVGTEVDYDGQTVPDGWEEVDEYETGSGNFDTSTQFAGNYQYVKCGKIVQLYTWIVLKQTISTPWTTLTLMTLPNKIKPKIVKNEHVMRDNDTRMYLVSVNIDGTFKLSDRGRGNITASADGIPVTFTYIAAD